MHVGCGPSPPASVTVAGQRCGRRYGRTRYSWHTARVAEPPLLSHCAARYCRHSLLLYRGSLLFCRGLHAYILQARAARWKQGGCTSGRMHTCLPMHVYLCMHACAQLRHRDRSVCWCTECMVSWWRSMLHDRCATCQARLGPAAATSAAPPRGFIGSCVPVACCPCAVTWHVRLCCAVPPSLAC